MTSRPLHSAAASLVLYGCATVAVEPEPGVPGGHISAKAGRPGFVVAAPHGSSDSHTGDMAAEVARRTGFGLVVASGFVLEPDSRERPGRRYQVNRPTEGIPGRPPSEEGETAAARRVHVEFERHVLEAAQTALLLYAEIHGNGHRDTAARIEIATVGIDRDEAWRVRTLLELIRDAHLGAYPAAPRLTVLIEPLDVLRYTASAAKRSGVLSFPSRALHIEMPRVAREDWRALYTDILSDFLEQLVSGLRLLAPASPGRGAP